MKIKVILLSLLLLVSLGNSCPKQKPIAPTFIPPVQQMTQAQLAVTPNAVVKTNIDVIDSNGDIVNIPLVTLSTDAGPSTYRKHYASPKKEELYLVIPTEPNVRIDKSIVKGKLTLWVQIRRLVAYYALTLGLLALFFYFIKKFSKKKT